MVIMVAPNGARRTSRDHAAIPLTPEELAETAEACLDAGASAMHLHVRDSEARHTLDPDRYRAALEAIHARVGRRLLLQVTTEAVGLYSAEEQMTVIRELVPEAVSLSVRELARAGEEAIAELDWWMREQSVLPQWILYSTEDQSLLNDWIRRDVLRASSYPVLFVLGKYKPRIDATPKMLQDFHDMQREKCWMACAFGPAEGRIMQTVADLGGHARIGFENNLVGHDGQLAPDNASLVRSLADHIHTEKVRRPATADDAREILRPCW
jgi:3-keto-5-aminohexanoate cleavage enzyme